MTTTIDNEQKTLNVPNLRFPEFEGEWKRTSLKDISTVNPKSASLEESFVYIDLEAVEKGILKKQQTILRSEAPSRAQRVIMDGDILFQCVRPYQKNNYLHKGQNNDKTQWVASTGYAQIRTTESPSYLYHTLNTDGFNKKVMVRCTGSSYPAINSDDLSTIHFYFSPQKEEQRKISQLFDLLDERIATQNKIIDKLQSLIKGINQEVFNGVGYSYKLGSICEIKSGYSGNQLIKKEGLKVSRIETISGHRINLERVGYVSPFKNSESYKLQVGDILFSNINSVEYIGNTAFVDKDYDLYHGMNLLRLIPNSKIVVPFYLYLLLNTRKMLNRFKTICNKAVSQASINQTDLGKTIIVLPSLENQIKICTIYEVLFSKIEAEKKCLSLYNVQKQYLLRQMFI